MGSFFREDRNLDRSRYRDVIPGELTRVKLQPDGDDKHDFINANYVTGHNSQDKAYIFTQGKQRPPRSRLEDGFENLQRWSAEL